MNFKPFAPMLLLCALCGCASAPQCPPPVVPPADIMSPPPPPGFFRQWLERILDKGQISGQTSPSSPAEPMSSQLNSEPASIF